MVELRDFRPQDLEPVLELRARVFGTTQRRRERRRWEWQFTANPARSSSVPCSWVLEEQGAVIGNYGLLPAQVCIDGRRVQAFCGMDFCVAPEHQGAGLGLLFTRRFLDPALCEFPFVTSPTADATALTRYFGAQVLEGRSEPCLWVLPQPAPAAPAARAAAAVQVTELEHFDARFDRWFEQLAARHRIVGVRDARALNWRYRDYPFGRPHLLAAADGAQVHGLCVYQHDPALQRGYLAELSAGPGARDVLLALLQRALELARADAAAELYVLHREAAVHAVLQEVGFLRVAEHPLTFLCRLPAGLTLADWYLAAGDGDLLFSVGTLP